MEKDIKVIDCFGDICPIPIIKIEQELETLKPGESFMLVTDHSCTMEAIKDKYSKSKVKLKSKEVMNGGWEVYIKKKR